MAQTKITCFGANAEENSNGVNAKVTKVAESWGAGEESNVLKTVTL